MKKTKLSSATPVVLRKRAEQELKRQPKKAGEARSEADTLRLVHELQVHQIELEMQNAELQLARGEKDAALKKYTELYELAPVAYFSLDSEGLIHEVNHTGATLFKAIRSALLNQHLKTLVAPTSWPVVEAILISSFSHPSKQACEALLQTTEGTHFWADLQAVSQSQVDNKTRWCHLAVSDISALKRGQEALLNVESLAYANLEANKEIARRRAAEATLKKSEQAKGELLLQSQVLHTQLRYLTHQLLLAQEEERKTISRQLHDEIAQILAGINVHLAALNESYLIRPQDLRKRVEETHRLVTLSIDIVHRFARNLRPALLDDLGLIPALRSYVKELAEQKGLAIEFSASAGVEDLDFSRRTVFYRIAQEALTNVARHANAKYVSVRIVTIPGALRLVVSDDGCSFPAKRLLAAQHGGRLGLLGMRERVEMVGGQFEIVSAPGKGTTVTAEIPLDTVGKSPIC